MINHSKKDLIQIAVRPGFVLVPRELFTLDLSANEFRIYVVLLTYEDRRTHTCYPFFRLTPRWSCCCAFFTKIQPKLSSRLHFYSLLFLYLNDIGRSSMFFDQFTQHLL